MSTKRRERVATGIYRDAYGYSVMASAGTKPHILYSPEVRFPLDTELPVMVARWHREKAKLKEEQTQHPTTKAARGTLAADVPVYFATKKLSKQRLQERTQQLAWWVEQFGTRRRATLLPGELQRALNTLRKSESTINKYRTALSNIFTVLDGKNASNPFRDVPREQEPEAARRDQPYELIQVILAKLRDRGQGKKPSRTKAYLRVKAYAPVTQAQLQLMGPGDIHWTTGEMSTPGRHKGAGTLGKRKPLSREALDAFRDFAAADCWGRTPSRSSMLRIFKVARDAAIAELRVTRPDLDLSRATTMLVKDLRHSFATLTFQRTGSLSVTQELLDHQDKTTTLRYAQGALPGHLRAAGQAIDEAFAAIPAYVPPTAPVAPSKPNAGRTSKLLLPSFLVDKAGKKRKDSTNRGVTHHVKSLERLGEETAKEA